MDEQPIELHADSREPIGLSESNHTEKIDHEYIRCGTFMFTEPLGRWRNVTAREHRKKLDWAEQIKALVYDDYPDAEKVVLVCDNINTHNFSSLHEAFTPSEARMIISKIELHHTPKHGSWLEIVGIELPVFTRQCLSRNIDSMEKLQKEVNAWYQDRNRRQKGVDWQFYMEDARVKLKHLYPVIELNN